MVALIAVVFALICCIACAEPVEPEPFPTVLQQPAYAEPALEAEPVPFQEMGIGCADECVDCGPMAVQESYWYAGVDLLATRFSYHGESSLLFSDEDAAIAIRPYLGWENSRGVGLRGRWWLYGTETKARMPGLFNSEYTLESNASTLDLDVYRRFYCDSTSLLLGAGTKIAVLKVPHFYYAYSQSDIVGGGISLFAEGHHPFYRGVKNEWAIIGYGRFGLLTGRIEHENRPDGWEYVDTNMAITELGLGIEWKHKFRRGDFVFQVVSEIQRWETNMTSDLAFDAVGVRFGGQW